MPALPYQTCDGRGQSAPELFEDSSPPSTVPLNNFVLETSTDIRPILASTSSEVTSSDSESATLAASIDHLPSTTFDSALPLAFAINQNHVSRPELLALPQEVLLHILAFLDVPDLVAVSRTCRTLHLLPSDPLLHRQRLHAVPPKLSHSLSVRPPLNALRPPNANIYLTTTLAAARAISRNLVCARLRRQLNRRPQVTELVDRGVLPGECFVFVTNTRTRHPERNQGDLPRSATNHGRSSSRKSISSGPSTVQTLPPSVSSDKRQTDVDDTHRHSISSDNTLTSAYSRASYETNSSLQTLAVTAEIVPLTKRNTSPSPRQKYVSPRLIEAKRAVEREAIRSRIRGWVDGRGKQELERRRRELELELQNADHKPAGSVMGLVRMFRAQSRRNGAFEAADDFRKQRVATQGDHNSAVGLGTESNVGSGSSNPRSSSSRADAQLNRDRERWGRGAAKWIEKRRREPTRAHVLGLRRFWESVGREG